MAGNAHQTDPTKLKGTIYPAAGETFPVSPSGDMARKAFYDRNAISNLNAYKTSGIGAHAETVRWSYTVPANKKCNHTMFSSYVTVAIATAGRFLRLRYGLTPSGGSIYIIDVMIFLSATLPTAAQVDTASFTMVEGDKLDGRTFHDDTVNHAINVVSLSTEYDV